MIIRRQIELRFILLRFAPFSRAFHYPIYILKYINKLQNKNIRNIWHIRRWVARVLTG